MDFFQTSIFEDPSYFISNVSGGLAFSIQVGVCCYAGETVSSGFDVLSVKLYESNWVGLIQERNCSQILLIMMEDMKRECVIFIGKIMPLRLATFASVCRL